MGVICKTLAGMAQIEGEQAIKQEESRRHSAGSLVSWAITGMTELSYSLPGDAQRTLTTHVRASPPSPCSVSLPSNELIEAYHGLGGVSM